jgi:benzoyl-CoA 2,3-dioxygenase component A
MNAPESIVFIRQHLIDPEVCIRCNTCEETCPVDAITHDDRNYVVDAAICNGCGNCVSPCPTGSIDHWHPIAEVDASAMEQSGAAAESGDAAGIQANAATSASSTIPPWSAAHPYLNLYTIKAPVTATVAGNFRLTAADAESDIRHIVLDFGTQVFPLLEGQSIGIIPPGVDAGGKPHYMRMYSVASARSGEREGYNNLALTVKRVVTDHAGAPANGVASNYLCDLAKGATVQVTGPFGASYLMPNHPEASLLMICTGTGSAPMRAMTEQRRRLQAAGKPASGKLMLFFGARNPAELPYFGPLLKRPAKDLCAGQAARSRHCGRRAAAQRYLPLHLRLEGHGNRRHGSARGHLRRARHRLACAAGAHGDGRAFSRRDVLTTYLDRQDRFQVCTADGVVSGRVATR